jgi:hypothetical protein
MADPNNRRFPGIMQHAAWAKALIIPGRDPSVDAQTKLVASWHIGARDGYVAEVFVRDLASRLANRVQITTDGHRPYLEAVEGAFGADVADLKKRLGANKL